MKDNIINKVTQLLRQKKFAESYPLLQQIHSCRQTPNTNLLASLAICAKAVGNKTEAIEYYSQALATQQDDPDPLLILQRGKCYFYLKQYHQAIADFSLCMDVYDEYCSLYRGLCYIHLKDYFMAYEDFHRFYQVSENAQQLSAIAQVLFKIERLELAEACLEKSFRLKPAMSTLTGIILTSYQRWNIDNCKLKFNQASHLVKQQVIKTILKYLPISPNLDITFAIIINDTSYFLNKNLSGQVKSQCVQLAQSLNRQEIIDALTYRPCKRPRI